MFRMRGSRLWVQGCIARAWSERRGVSGGLRHRGAVPHGAGPAALAGRLRLPLLRPSGHCVLAGRGLYQCNRCKKQTSPTAGTIFHATKLPLTLWFAAIHDRDGEERHLVGGTRPPSRGQAADGLDREAQDHGGDGAARGGDTAYGAGGDGRRLSRRGALRRQAGPRRGGQDALRGGGLDQSRGAPAQAEAGAGQGLPQARDRARRQALAGPLARSVKSDGRPGHAGTVGLWVID